MQHVFWHCPRYAFIRQELGMSDIDVHGLPRSTKCLSAVPNGYNFEKDNMKMQLGMTHFFTAVLRDSGVQLNAK